MVVFVGYLHNAVSIWLKPLHWTFAWTMDAAVVVLIRLLRITDKQPSCWVRFQRLADSLGWHSGLLMRICMSLESSH